MDNFMIELERLDRVVSVQGEIAWKLESIPYIVDMARKYNRIILGGDVLTASGKYTYDNWYYVQESNAPRQTNVERSINKCLQYINNYLQKHGEQFAFIIVFA